MREQHTLSLRSEYWVKNEQIFTENMEALKEKETIQAQSAQLEFVVAEACRSVSELHIPKEVLLKAKIRKPAASVRDAKVDVA